MFVCLFFFKVVIQSDSHKKMDEYMKKYYSIHSIFFFGGLRILERETIEDRVELLESNSLNC